VTARHSAAECPRFGTRKAGFTMKGFDGASLPSVALVKGFAECNRHSANRAAAVVGETKEAPGENEGMCLHRPLLCSRRILVLRRRPSLCCRPRPLCPRLPSVAGDDPCACGLCACQGEGEPQRRLPTVARSYQAGVDGAAEARMECEPTNPALFLVADLCCRVEPACFFPAPSRASFTRVVRTIPSFPARKPRASHSRKPRVLIIAARLNDRVNAPNV
jgi:hypothetical protein